MYVLSTWLPEYKDSFMDIKFDYCICIRIHEKAHIRSDFWQSIDYKYVLQQYYFGGGQKFMQVSFNEWSLVEPTTNLYIPQIWYPKHVL